MTVLGIFQMSRRRDGTIIVELVNHNFTILLVVSDDNKKKTTIHSNLGELLCFRRKNWKSSYEKYEYILWIHNLRSSSYHGYVQLGIQNAKLF